MDGIPISTGDFKALSSKTRTGILKLLAERNFTLSELASKTDMAAPTVKQHASVLIEAGLIELRDEGRKWKYYSLTRKGKKLLEANANRSNIFVILSSAIIIGLLGFALLFSSNFFQQTAQQGVGAERRTAAIIPYETDALAEIISSEEAAGASEKDVGEKCVSAVGGDEATNELCNAFTSMEECEAFDAAPDGTKDCKWTKFDD